MTREDALKAWKQMYSEIDKENWLFVGTINPQMVEWAIKALADRKTENSSEKPNNSTCSKMEQVEDEPKTQMKTQNSNLTFEKRTMRDCYNCKRYETEGECIECHYEPKDEPQTDWETEKRDNSLCYKCVKECDRRVLNRYTIECNQYEPKDEPQMDCESCKHYNPNHEAIACERCLDGKYSRYEPQTERSE